MQVPVYNMAGEVVRQAEISDQVFAVPFNEGVVHQVMVRQRANARQGTASTKTKSEVSASTRKLFRQKGTGEARSGSRRSPLHKGGGITFGPKPRDYRQEIPKKMRRLALKCVLSAKMESGQMKVLEELGFDAPKTSQMAHALTSLGVESSALIVTAGPEEMVIKSARNLPGIKTMPANILNVLDILSYKTLLMTESAVRKAERLWGDGASQGGNDASL
ncbi:MAG: 50S ribosomal protein L4 [Chloroflexota bacterium]